MRKKQQQRLLFQYSAHRSFWTSRRDANSCVFAMGLELDMRETV